MAPVRGAILVSVFLATTALGASVASQQPPPSFRAGVDLIMIDVQITPAAKAPLRDLTPADFSISINDRQRPAASATLLHFDEGPVGGKPMPRPGVSSPPECVFAFQRKKNEKTAHYLVGVAAIDADRKGIVVRLKLVDKGLAAEHFVWRTPARPRGAALVVSR